MAEIKALSALVKDGSLQVTPTTREFGKAECVYEISKTTHREVASGLRKMLKDALKVDMPPNLHRTKGGNPEPVEVEAFASFGVTLGQNRAHRA